jgi:hypothetical protein
MFINGERSVLGENKSEGEEEEAPWGKNKLQLAIEKSGE